MASKINQCFKVNFQKERKKKKRLVEKGTGGREEEVEKKKEKIAIKMKRDTLKLKSERNWRKM